MDNMFIGMVTFKNGSFLTVKELRMDKDVLIVTTSVNTYKYDRHEKKFYTYDGKTQLYGDNILMFEKVNWEENKIIQRITYMGSVVVAKEES